MSLRVTQSYYTFEPERTKLEYLFSSSRLHYGVGVLIVTIIINAKIAVVSTPPRTVHESLTIGGCSSDLWISRGVAHVFVSLPSLSEINRGLICRYLPPRLLIPVDQDFRTDTTDRHFETENGFDFRSDPGLHVVETDFDLPMR